jgi:CRP/FNR family transcriptional regulator, cyclic AMP receptor protein
MPGDALTETKVTHSLVTALRAVPGFASVDERMLLALIGDSANLFWPVDSVVFERGTPADGLYIIVSGSVRVIDRDGGEVAVMGPGDFFGELSLLLDTTHRHDIRIAEDAELMVLPKERLDELTASHPELGRAIRERAEERLAI